MLGVLWTMIFNNDTAIVTAEGITSTYRILQLLKIWTWTFLTSEDRLQGGAPIFRFFQYLAKIISWNIGKTLQQKLAL